MPTKKSPNKPPHKAICYLKYLHKKHPSSEFVQYLSSFATARDKTLEVFVEGIEAFTKIANLHPSKRIKFYGNQFAGLHYNNDLAKLWNKMSSDVIRASQLNYLSPPEWDYQSVKEGWLSLIYKGDKLSSALDKLIQGPTVIDCGMFCQLSLWFGIRYMLGNTAFDQLFGNAPFYLTQLTYDPIAEPYKPYLGNLLYPFLEFDNKENFHEVYISNVKNHACYFLKHPGGNYSNDNCVVIRGKYIIFDPSLENTAELSRSDVEQLLLGVFNAQQDSNDEAKIAAYQTQNPKSIHPGFEISYGELVACAKTLSDYKIDEQEFRQTENDNKDLHVRFNFKKFCQWVMQISDRNLDVVDYEPLSVDQLRIPESLLTKIPYENQSDMSFSTFKADTPLHEEMFAIAKKFCFDVMNKKSVCVILTGKAGIGKTASAVSCAKELISREKKIIWISEVMVRGWADKSKSKEELSACEDEIRQLLQSDPDAVFLDDDNLIDYSGKILLEEIYGWYVTHLGRGLFITSNEPITFKECYGLKFDKKYYYPPFTGYFSEQYQNTLIRSGLNAGSMRMKPDFNIAERSDEEKTEQLASHLFFSCNNVRYDLDDNDQKALALLRRFPKQRILLI